MNVLFTSVGRRVELLRAFRAAYDHLALPGRIVAIDIDALAPALRFADAPYIVPRLSDDAYLPALLEICRQESISLIFPLIDPDIPVLARHRGALEAIGARPAVPTEAGAAIASDKWRTFRFFEGLGIQTPRSWLPDDAALSSATLPLFIKPRRGSASQHTYRVTTRDELAFFSRYVPEPIVQEFVQGYEITTDVVCGVDGAVLGMVSRQRMEVRSGEVMKGVTVRNDAVLDACERIATALEARGPITVQCIMQHGVPFFTEINARFGGGLPLGIAAGVDAPALVLAAARGDARNVPQREYRCGLYVTRFDDSLFITEAEREQMASRRL